MTTPSEDIRTAFYRITEVTPEPRRKFYLVLRRSEQYYGGPEEGGWWGWDHLVEAFKMFASKEEAEQAYDQVQDYIKTLNRECAEARLNGLNRAYEDAVARDPAADLDGEDDNRCGLETHYSVDIEDHEPKDEYGPQHYE
jgi:hypothetical protein